MKYKMKKLTAMWLASTLVISSIGVESEKTVYANATGRTTTSSSAIENSSGGAIVTRDLEKEPVSTQGAIVFDKNDFTHSFNSTGTEATILGLTSAGKLKLGQNSGELVIPAELNGRPVKHIGGLFRGDNIRSVSFPSSIETIASYAFSANMLTSVTIPGNVTTIEPYAFAENELEAVIIENGVTTIDEGAFGDNNITSVSIPNSVTTIGDGAFWDNSLTSVSIPNSVTTIDSSAFAGNNLTSVTIPNSVTTIEGNAFANNNLTSVTIPNSVTTIGYRAFADNNLTTVTIPNSVTTIGDSAFADNNLTSVTIPNSVTTIGYSAFADNNLTSVIIPNSVTSIGNEAFLRNNLTEVVLPNSLTTLENSIFVHNKLESIEIPDSVETIGYDTFAANELTSVTIPKNVKIIMDMAFAANNLTSLTIEEGVEEIGEFAFSNNINKDAFIYSEDFDPDEYVSDIALSDYTIEEIVLPSTLKSIGEGAFDKPEYAFINRSNIPYVFYDESSYYNTDEGYKLLQEEWEEDQWSADRLHKKTIDISKGVIENNAYRYFEVEVVDLEPYGATFKDGSTVLYAPSFLTKSEALDFIYREENIPVKEGYEFVLWDTLNRTNGFEELNLGEDTSNYYLVNDISGIKPVFVADDSEELGLNFYIEEEASQKNIFKSNLDATGALVNIMEDTLDPNQMTTLSLQQGYSFLIDYENLYESIELENIENGVKAVSKFEDDVDYFQFMINENDTVIYIKGPKAVRFTDNTVPGAIRIHNLGVKNTYEKFGGNKDTKNVNLVIGSNIDGEMKYVRRQITSFEFMRTFATSIVPSTNKNAVESNTDSSIAVMSKARYSFEDNQLFEISLTEGYEFIHAYGNIESASDDFYVFNSAVTESEYVASVDDLKNEAAVWQYTLSDDKSTIYVKAPINLFGKARAMSGVETDGVAFQINNLGVRDKNGDRIVSNGAEMRTIEITVKTEDFEESTLFAELESADPEPEKPTTSRPTTSNPTTTAEVEEVVVMEEVTYESYLNGYADGTIRPSNMITRAEFVSMLYNMFGDNIIVSQENLEKFTDLKSNVWYSNAIAFGIDRGLLAGYEDNTFRPNEPITRAEIAAILSRLNPENIGIVPTYENATTLSDIDSSWASESIQSLVDMKVVGGYTDGTFRPNNNATRAEAVTFLNRITDRPYDYYVENTFHDLIETAWFYDDIMSASNTTYEFVVVEAE